MSCDSNEQKMRTLEKAFAVGETVHGGLHLYRVTKHTPRSIVVRQLKQILGPATTCRFRDAQWGFFPFSHGPRVILRKLETLYTVKFLKSVKFIPQQGSVMDEIFEQFGIDVEDFSNSMKGHVMELETQINVLKQERETMRLQKESAEHRMIGLETEINILKQESKPMSGQMKALNVICDELAAKNKRLSKKAKVDDTP